MKKFNLIILFLAFIMTSCIGKQDNSTSKEDKATSEEIVKTDIDIQAIKERLCTDFPKDLVLGYNPGTSHIEIETIDNGSGGILHCNVKLFYGDKEYEYWEGQVAAGINKMADPFWQYSPERNASLYHKIEGHGDKAVYITNMYQLQILKEGVLYYIVPPYHGNTTHSGKENKAIALEIAEHYNL